MFFLAVTLANQRGKKTTNWSLKNRLNFFFFKFKNPWRRKILHRNENQNLTMGKYTTDILILFSNRPLELELKFVRSKVA